MRILLPLLALLAQAVCAQSVQVVDPRLPEASGIAASRLHAEHVYVHNDSRNRPEVYLLAPDGTVRLRVQLVGVGNRDWEDIAVFERDGQSLVCVAEIGDNRTRHRDVFVYCFAEPKLEDGVDSVRLRPQRYTLRYPDRAHNAEAFAVDPRTGAGLILTKREDGTTRLYQLAAPWKTSGVNELVKLQELKLPIGGKPGQVTAADVHPSGERLMLRSYLMAWEYRIDRPAAASQPTGFPGEAKQPMTLPLQLVGPPRRVHLPIEPQGEAICYTPDGQAVQTISEKLPTYLYRVPLE